MTAAKDHQTFSSANFQQDTGAPTLMLVNHDDPEHAQLRRLVMQAFTPRRVAALRPHVEAVVAQLLDDLPAGEVDVVSRLCAPLPARLMVRLLGQPESMTERFQFWANAFMLSADMSVEERGRSNVEMVAYFQSMVDARRARLDTGAAPQDDLVDALLVAGAQTTMYYAANCLHLLLQHPDVFARLRAEPALIPRFQQEAHQWGVLLSYGFTDAVRNPGGNVSSLVSITGRNRQINPGIGYIYRF